jgi:arsenate reductase-like glutaredoxin family protein
VQLQLRDLFKQPLSKQELKELLGERPVSDLFASRSPTVRKLGLDVPALSDDQKLDLMVQYPQLIRRPLMIRDGELIIGYDKKRYASL